MKRFLLILISVVAIVFVYAGSQSPIAAPGKTPGKKSCTGYEIIEAGKGINCYGDTIKLTKRSGFYEVASNSIPNSASAF